MFRQFFLPTLILALFASRSGAEDTDYAKLVASLAQRNPEPKLNNGGMREIPTFAKDFDWKEQDRVVAAVKVLASHVQEAWPAIVDGLDDERYGLTLEGDMSARNESVSGICEQIIIHSIGQGYDIPGYQIAYFRMQWPGYIPLGDHKKFVAWCRSQQEKERTLVELQIEAGEWALTELQKLRGVRPEDIRKSTEKTKEIIEQLRRTKKPLLNARFFDGDGQPYSKENLGR